MLASLFNILILTAIVFAGVYIACKGYAYEISTRRMLLASLTFAVLMTLPIPIPIVDLIVPAREQSSINDVYTQSHVRYDVPPCFS